MSKERQRARSAREAKQAAERQRKAKAAARREKVERLKPELPKRQPVYRQRRFPPLPIALKVTLALGWLATATAIFALVPTWTARIGFLVIATFTLPLIVVIVRDPTRRTR